MSVWYNPKLRRVLLRVGDLVQETHGDGLPALQVVKLTDADAILHDGATGTARSVARTGYPHQFELLARCGRPPRRRTYAR